MPREFPLPILHFSDGEPSCIIPYYYQSQLNIPRHTTYLANKVFQTSPGDSWIVYFKWFR